MFSFRCFIPNCDSPQSEYEENFLNFTTPNSDRGWSQCSHYPALNESINATYNLWKPSNVHYDWSGRDDDSFCFEDNYDSLSNVDCDAGYVYDTSLITSSSVIEVCYIFYVDI